MHPPGEANQGSRDRRVFTKGFSPSPNLAVACQDHARAISHGPKGNQFLLQIDSPKLDRLVTGGRLDPAVFRRVQTPERTVFFPKNMVKLSRKTTRLPIRVRPDPERSAIPSFIVWIGIDKRTLPQIGRAHV